jgi:serine/threonine protein kinase
MDTGPAYFYTLLDPYFFESLDRYRPSNELLDVVKPRLDETWAITRGGFWTNIRPKAAPRLPQGWKIHVSSTVEQASETLGRIAPLLVQRHVGFKFCSDLAMVQLSLNKNWPRTGGGKFITIYPVDLEDFKRLIEDCYQVTDGMAGPYILSDRPYRDSRVVFYRYGEHWGDGGVNAYGVRVPTLVSSTGERLSDERLPYFTLPPGVTDPFTPIVPLEPPGEDGVLLNGRYRVTMAIKFSNMGGIYQAQDTFTGQDVIIREARPMLAHMDYDAQRLLRKEARILQTLRGTGLLPEFIELFGQWEHLFLVQEKLEAENLWAHAMDFALDDGASAASLFKNLRKTAHEIVRGLRTIHEARIVLRDMTRSNVLFTDKGEVKFIDLEFAYELDGADPPVAGWTTGYASPEQMRNQTPTFADDYYALGALFLDMVSFTAPGLGLNREGMLRSLAMDLLDFRQPEGIVEIIGRLTSPDIAHRWTPEQALVAFDALPRPTDRTPLFPKRGRRADRPRPRDALRSEVARTVEGIADYVLRHSDHSRDDRLWPASGDVFHTNPVQLQYGAAGTAYFLLHAVGEVPQDDVGWVIEHLRTRPLPPGLHSGAAGVALLLSDLGESAHASSLMDVARESHQLLALPNLYYGAAGCGIANLALWSRTGDSRFLEDAVAIGKELMGSAREDEHGLSWEADGYFRLGYGEGQSGTALFFLYLYAATDDARFLQTGLRALDFDLSYAVDIDFGVLWFPHIAAKPGDPKSPHIRYGSAGIGTAALRAYLLSAEERFLRWAERCAHTVSTRYTNKPWHDYGMAGYIEFLLDMYKFLGDEAYLNTAWHIAERLVVHRIEMPEGFAYLGQDLERISCDFGMGSAGIGLALYRLLNPKTPRLILPDQLLVQAREPEDILGEPSVQE